MLQALVFGRNPEDDSAVPTGKSEWGAAMGVIFTDVLQLPMAYGVV